MSVCCVQDSPGTSDAAVGIPGQQWWGSLQGRPEVEHAQVTFPQMLPPSTPHPPRCHQSLTGKKEQPEERYRDVVCGNDKKSHEAAGRGLLANREHYLSILFSANLMGIVKLFHCGFGLHRPNYPGIQASFCMFRSHLYFYAMSVVFIFLLHCPRGTFIPVTRRCCNTMGHQPFVSYQCHKYGLPPPLLTQHKLNNGAQEGQRAEEFPPQQARQTREWRPP